MMASEGISQVAVVKFVNGRVFNGQHFQKQEFYIQEGIFSFREPARVDSVIDLGNGYVIPPFGDAHTHLFSRVEDFSKHNDLFIKDGVFYAMNQDPIYTLTDTVIALAEQKSTVDISYTRGVVTASWNIVAGLYRQFGEQGMFGEKKSLQELDTKNVFLMDDRNDLINKWPLLEEKNPDFIKIIIAFSEEQEKRKNNPGYSFELGSYSMTPGIDPELLTPLVNRAHMTGLRSSVHIETAADFRLAVKSGTDFIAHLPGSWQVGVEKTGYSDLNRWKITHGAAKQAAEKNVIVITTAIPPEDTPHPDDYSEIHTHNIALLENRKVPIILGSDRFDKTIRAEVFYLKELGVFDNRTLLNRLTLDTPRAIFPDRKIGKITEGFEASFLVLEKNPLADIKHISTIRMRVKEGRLLRLNPN